MNKLSVCIICMNEEDVLEQCLQSVSWADEIVIVDSGSTDKSLDIAKKYKANVHYNKWPGFGLQRQKAESLASNSWILAIDCDEVISVELKNEIQGVFSQTDIPVDHVYYVNRLTKLFGKFIKHGEMHPDWIGRIYNKTHTGYDDILVHEKVKVSNCKKIYLKSKLLHYYKSTFKDYQKKLLKYAEHSAQDKFNKKRRSNRSDGYVRAVFAFIKNYVIKLGFLDGSQGFKIAYARYVYTKDKYLLLIEKYK